VGKVASGSGRKMAFLEENIVKITTCGFVVKRVN